MAGCRTADRRNMGRRAIIVGAGIGGLSAAVALALRGWEVRVLEQAPELGEVGAGLQISPNGYRVLHALGLSLPLRAIALKADGVVLRLLATGICRSDWHVWEGADPDVELPHIPGHEFCGEVVAVGRDVRRWNTGDRVIAPFILGCGTCPSCVTQHPRWSLI